LNGGFFRVLWFPINKTDRQDIAEILLKYRNYWTTSYIYICSQNHRKRFFVDFSVRSYHKKLYWIHLDMNGTFLLLGQPYIRSRKSISLSNTCACFSVCFLNQLSDHIMWIRIRFWNILCIFCLRSPCIIVILVIWSYRLLSETHTIQYKNIFNVLDDPRGSNILFIL
jgi:hypothetical protein